MPYTDSPLTSRRRIASLAVLLVLGTCLMAAPASAQAVRVGPTFDVTSIGARYTDVAWDPVNRVYLVVWGEFGTVRGRFVSGDGTPLGPAAFKIPTTDAQTWAPKAAYDPDDGVFMVVWQDNRINPDVPVPHARALAYQPDGTPAFRALDFQVGWDYVYSTSPTAVAYATGSKAFLALYSTGPHDVRGVRFTVDGAMLGTTISISSTPDYETLPSVTYNSAADEFYVVYAWWVDAIGLGGVRGQRVKAGTGELIGPAFDVDGASPYQNGPSVASYDPANDRYMVAWYRGIPEGLVTLGRLVNPANTAGDPRFTIAPTGSKVSMGLSRNPVTGSFMTVFNHQEILDVYGTEVTADGAATGMIQVTDSDAVYGVDYASVAAASDRPQWLAASVKFWSAVLGQRVAAAGTVPTFSKTSPLNGATTQPSSLTLAWGTMPGASYEVCVDTTYNSTCDTTWQSAGFATTFGLSGLANGTYYWQVRATVDGVSTYANYETWWSFSVGTPPPALFNKLSPSNGMTGLGSTVTLSWSAAAGATAYQVCIDYTKDDSCFGGSGWVPIGAVLTYQLTGQPEGNYAWQIRAMAGTAPLALADNGVEYTYTVGGAPPSTFSKVSPANGATGLGSSVTATWNAMPGAVEYQGCLDTVNDNSCNTTWQSAGTSTVWGLTNLAAGTYYWQVRARLLDNSLVLADNGTSWSFTVGGAPPPTFGKLTPGNGVSGLSSTVTLTWSTLTGASYLVCWDTTNNNTCDGAWWPNAANAGRTLTDLPNGTYYWQVRASTASGTVEADNSTWWSFTVGAAPPPAAFGKSSPANAATNMGSAVTLTWSASTGATGYQVCLDTTNDAACSTAWQSAGAATSLAQSGLANGLYYWQVRAQNAAGTTDADSGTWWSFRVGPVPPTFSKTSPANGASGLASTVTVLWTALADASYLVCWDTTNNNTCDGAWWPNAANAGRTLTDLPNGTYYWQVRASTPLGTFEADDGVWWSFTVGAAPVPGAFGKVSPASGAAGLGTAVTLTWGAAGGATGYQVCVDQTNDSACSAAWQSAGVATTFGLSGLSTGTYYWQVRAQNAAGTTEADAGAWWSFSVSAPVPGAFGKAVPANGASGLGSAVTLTWGVSSGATGYQLCVDTTNDNACGGTWQSAGAATTFGLSGLVNGLYYWQARAQNAAGTTDADSGTWWSFRVGPVPPTFTKTSPASGTSGLGSTVTLLWSALPDAGYLVCWDTTNNNACDGAWWPNGGGAGRTLTGLADGTYYWQVRASTPSGTFDADSGTWWVFTVGAAATPPGAFGKSAPASGATGLGTAVTLTWGTSSGATSYEVCYDTTNDGACGATWVSAGTATSSALGGLASGTYYWQVRAANASGTTSADGGTWWSFSVGTNLPAAFSKTSPANGATGLGSAVTLTWGASTGATAYQVCVDTTNDNSCGTTWQSAGAATTLAQSGLANGLYYWQVRAQNSGGTTDANGGTWWSFRVGTAPPTFGKLTPANGVSGLGSSVTLTWSALADAGYTVCWDTTNNNACDSAWWPNGGNAGRTLTDLPNGTYYWQVRASTPSGTFEADSSTWFAFTVGGPPQPPGAFGKTAPANGASGLAGSLTLSWGASSSAASYEVCVDTTNDGACSTTWQSSGAAASLGLSGLAAGTYYWQARAVNVTGTTYADGGVWWSFSVSATPPLFSKLAPANGATDLASSVTLQWSPVADAGYYVCWDTTNNNTCDSGWWPNGGVSARTLAGLPPGTYYWQVRATRSSGSTDADNGTWWTFTVR